MKIIIKQVGQYGATVFHPVCDNAKTFALIAKTKTLTHDTLRAVKALGYQIEVTQPQPITL